MDEIGIKELKRYEFFKHLPDSVLEELATQVDEMQVESNEVIFQKGDPSDALYLIHRGWVKIVGEDSDGSEVILNQIGPGNIVGEMAITDSEPRSSGVIAITPSELLKLESEAFLDFIRTQPAVGMHVIRDISERLRFANTYLENAIEWSQRITAGDYSFAKEQMAKAQATIVMTQQGAEDRANRFLANFFEMVEDIKAREKSLQNELDQLIITIDEAKRGEDVSHLAGSEFFKKLRSRKGKHEGNE